MQKFYGFAKLHFEKIVFNHSNTYLYDKYNLREKRALVEVLTQVHKESQLQYFGKSPLVLKCRDEHEQQFRLSAYLKKKYLLNFLYFLLKSDSQCIDRNSIQTVGRFISYGYNSIKNQTKSITNFRICYIQLPQY